MTELQENLRDRILSLEHEFIKFLKPSDVIFDIQGLDDCLLEKILETEKTSREEAVKVLLTNVLDDTDMLSKFVFALESKGYRRFIDPINGTYPKKGVMFCQDYIGFIMNYLKGELIDVLQTETLCRYMYAEGCLEQSDIEHIEAVCSTRGRTAACKELFLAVKRRKANWALLMVEAIRSTQEYVKVKMDPSSTQEDLERTGVCSQEHVEDRSLYFKDETDPYLKPFDVDLERTGVCLQEHVEDRSLYFKDETDPYLKPFDVHLKRARVRLPEHVEDRTFDIADEIYTEIDVKDEDLERTGVCLQEHVEDRLFHFKDETNPYLNLCNGN
ncbi:Hypothetical predicted protein [Mytilus galloprovincialis]|uniref:Caspase recruitment domain-containing protein n=1 Tax=Mytilus galloprovincialis TaxID=29158 RepID=A0A8B6DJK8_MYTGA|nr:Hypothetical predicted protein [Mytilus galloprovincialis]